MTVSGGNDWFVSKEFRAAMEGIRKQVIKNVDWPKIKYVPPNVTIPAAAFTNLAVSVQGMNDNSAKELQKAFKKLDGSPSIKAALAAVQAGARLPTSPDLDRTLATIRAITVKYVFDDAQQPASTARPMFIADLAQSTRTDPAAVASVLGGVEQAVEEEVEADAILASARGKRITKLTPEQATETTQFLNRWLWNFELDLAVLHHIFGDVYLFQVLEWAAMLAVLQVFVVAMLLPSADEGDSAEADQDQP